MAGCLAFLLVSTTSSAAPGADPPLVVFGDSLSDSGNAFAFIHQNATPPDFGLDSLLVPTAPYAIGGHHFTNGETWVEQLAARFGVQQSTLPAFASANPNAMNFAIATARARDDGTCGTNPTPSCHPSLALLIARFLQKTGGVAPSGTLYVIQVGSNDVRDAVSRIANAPPGEDPQVTGTASAAILNSALQGIRDGVALLYAAGARKFLVWNVPGPALTPAIRSLGAGVQGAAVFAAGLFNTSLGQFVAAYPQLLVGFDADAALTQAFVFPARFGFTNVSDPCVMPGIPPFTCRTPDQYLFWDGIHPTTAGHNVIARKVAERLSLSY